MIQVSHRGDLRDFVSSFTLLRYLADILKDP